MQYSIMWGSGELSSTAVEKRGCCRLMKAIDLANKRFNKLVVLQRSGSDAKGNLQWLCRCDCGKAITVRGDHLRKGVSGSCGCNRVTHGKTGTPEYFAWMGMIARCKNSKNSEYHHYGGRGINVCERWSHFENFLSDMGERPSPEHSLDRIDNNSGYSPENCRWATLLTQANNKRTNHVIVVGGQPMTVAQAARMLGLSWTTTLKRWNRGEL